MDQAKIWINQSNIQMDLALICDHQGQIYLGLARSEWIETLSIKIKPSYNN